jgi:transposase
MTSMTSLTPATAKPRSAADALTAGIDTHKNTHHVAIVDHLGRPVADRAFNTTIGGYRAIGTFLHDHGHVERVGVEGTGSRTPDLVRSFS